MGVSRFTCSSNTFPHWTKDGFTGSRKRARLSRLSLQWSRFFSSPPDSCDLRRNLIAETPIINARGTDVIRGGQRPASLCVIRNIRKPLSQFRWSLILLHPHHLLYFFVCLSILPTCRHQTSSILHSTICLLSYTQLDARDESNALQ